MWTFALPLLLGVADAAPPPADSEPVAPSAASVLQMQPATAIGWAGRREAPRAERRLALPLRPLRWRVPMAQDSVATTQELGAPEAVPKKRSRNLLLGSAGAGVASAGLLLGASLVRDAYLEPGSDPTRGDYRLNRVLGHAGYASAVASGALFLGALRMGEW